MSALDLGALLGNPDWPQHVEQVDFGLSRAVTTRNDYIGGPIARLMSVRGKRLRPALTLAAFKAIHPEVTSNVITGAVAVELVHIASVVHDDIIDNASTRWNVPTINTYEGVSTAILVGDFLLARAAQQASLVHTEVANVIAESIVELTQGEAYEIRDTHNIGRTLEAYIESIRGKTAMLMSTACRVGALCAHGSDKQIQSLADYGEYLGMAFQLIDDVLDFVATPEALGKPIGKDLEEGVYTIPVILALQSPNGGEIEALLHHRSIAAHEQLTSILINDGYLKQTLIEARKYNHLARMALQDFPDDAVAGLLDLPDAYMKWSIANNVDPLFKSQII